MCVCVDFRRYQDARLNRLDAVLLRTAWDLCTRFNGLEDLVQKSFSWTVFCSVLFVMFTWSSDWQPKSQTMRNVMSDLPHH